MAWLSSKRPDADAGLLPVVVQDAGSGELLMVAYANREALEASERTGEAHFWSRSRNELWRKGATSGNTMALVDISTDCDGDAVRYRVHPAGPACHTGTRSCFPEAGDQTAGELSHLAAVVEQRRGADPSTSYTARLLEGGPRRPAEKVSEEAGELVAAALAGSAGEVREEAADLLYHVLVLLAARGVTLAEVEAVLASRRR